MPGSSEIAPSDGFEPLEVEAAEDLMGPNGDGQIDDGIDPAEFLGQVERYRQECVYKRPTLYPEQERAIFDSARYSWIEATTKAGKTSGCVVWLGEKALLSERAGRNYWWVAPIYAQAKIAFTRMAAALPDDVRTVNLTELRIDLISGAHVYFKTGEKPDSLYGEDVYAVVIDEASRMKEESFHAIRSTLTATRGDIRIIGNVKGRKNWFYIGCRKAEAGESGHSYHKITWKQAVAAGILDKAEIDDARAVLPERVFKMLYEAEPSDDEGNPFGVEAIRACIVAEYSKRPVKVHGQDLAKSHDWNYNTALDREGWQVSAERWQAPWRITKGRIAAITKGKPCLVDSTGVGDAILEDLQAIPGGNFQGYTFTSISKQHLMEGLAVAIQGGRVRFHDPILIKELESFEYAYTAGGVRYSAPEGMHDDCVCGLALAVHHHGPQIRSIHFESASYRSGPDDRSSDDSPPPADAPYRQEHAGQSWEREVPML